MVMRSYRDDKDVKNRKLAQGTVRRVLGYARPYKVIVIAFLITLVFDAVLVVAQPLLFRRIIDKGVTPGDSQVVTSTAILIAVIAVVDSLLTLVGRWYSSRIGEGLIYDLRTQVFDHVQRMPVAFFTRTQTGALVSRLNSDVIGAQQAFTSTMSGVVGNAISLVAVVIAMMALSWQITLASLVLLPLFLIPARYMGRTLQGLTREQMQLNAEMSTQMTERFNVAGALLVKLFGRPAEESADFSGRSARVRDIGVRIAMANRIFFTALTLVAALATALVYGVGGNLAITGAITVGTLLALAALLTRLYGPLTALSNVRVDVMTALVSFERVFEVLDLEPMVQDKDGKQVSVEFLIDSPPSERIVLFYKPSLARLGIDVTVRTVDTAQYQNRLRNFDYDIITDVWGQSLSPGNEQRDFWGTQAADIPGSRNTIGIKNPIVDKLIDKIIFAKDRATLVAATKALDRILLWHYYVVPQFTYGFSRYARWDRFSHAPLPKYGRSGLPALWWFDKQKADKIGKRS